MTGEVGALSVAAAPLIKDAPAERQAASPARGDTRAIRPVRYEHDPGLGKDFEAALRVHDLRRVRSRRAARRCAV